MKSKVVIAGATGNLGQRIIKALMQKEAEVIAVVRQGSDKAKVDALKNLGATVLTVDMSSEDELVKACEGVECVVSALQGLRDVIVDTQSVLLRAAVTAGVPRFIPSDFSVDFTNLPGGDNRNFDLRREFHKELQNANITAVSIFNGAFAEILSYNIPVLDFRKKTVGYWGSNPDHKLDFTTMDETANYTAAVAMDANATGAMHIASFQISPNELVALATEVSKEKWSLVNMGTLDEFAAYNRHERAAHPEGENEIFPRWQNGQYMHDMFSAEIDKLDNDRYPELQWTSARSFIGSILKH